MVHVCFVMLNTVAADCTHILELAEFVLSGNGVLYYVAVCTVTTCIVIKPTTVFLLSQEYLENDDDDKTRYAEDYRT